MIPHGTKVLIRRPAGGWESDNGFKNANREGYVSDFFPSFVKDLNVCQIDIDGEKIYVYESELQVLELPRSVDVIGGTVIIGDDVAWPQRSGSRMWMVHGTVSDITNRNNVLKITINKNGKRHSTTNIERVVKICPTIT